MRTLMVVPTANLPRALCQLPRIRDRVPAPTTVVRARKTPPPSQARLCEALVSCDTLARMSRRPLTHLAKRVSQATDRPVRSIDRTLAFVARSEA